MEVYAHLGMMKAAEYCCRRYLKLADSKNSQMEALLCLAHLALRAINYRNQESPRWLGLGQEAISEIMKHNSNNTLSQLFAGLFSYHDKNMKNTYRFSKPLLTVKHYSAIEIPQYLAFLYFISKKESDTIQSCLQNCDSNRMLSIMYYHMGLYTKDKRYLCYAIHLDPVQDIYWQALHRFN